MLNPDYTIFPFVPSCFGSLNVRTLLDTSSQFLAELEFTDPFSQQKQFENEQALKTLDAHFKHLDSLTWDDRQLNLAKGILAGNVFDWGAMEIRKIMESQDFRFEDAQEKLQGLFPFWFGFNSRVQLLDDMLQNYGITRVLARSSAWQGDSISNVWIL